MDIEELRGTEVQVTDLRRSYQTLEIDLQSQLSMVSPSDHVQNSESTDN